MGYSDTLSRGASRVVLTQAVLTLTIAGGFGVARGLTEVLAALYGGMITILITAWLARRVRRAGETHAAAAGLTVIYSSIAVRYATVVLLVGAGIGLLKLPPLPLLVAFAVTQFGFLVNVRRA